MDGYTQQIAARVGGNAPLDEQDIEGNGACFFGALLVSFRSFGVRFTVNGNKINDAQSLRKYLYFEALDAAKLKAAVARMKASTNTIDARAKQHFMYDYDLPYDWHKFMASFKFDTSDDQTQWPTVQHAFLLAYLLNCQIIVACLDDNPDAGCPDLLVFNPSRPVAAVLVYNYSHFDAMVLRNDRDEVTMPLPRNEPLPSRRRPEQHTQHVTQHVVDRSRWLYEGECVGVNSPQLVSHTFDSKQCLATNQGVRRVPFRDHVLAGPRRV